MEPEIKKRFNRIKGQFNGLEKMIDRDQDCLEVLNQISAIRSALDALGTIVLSRETACLKIKKSQRDQLKALLERFIKNKLT
jgi:DNA-binding FrmR family transcriptional regulator